MAQATTRHTHYVSYLPRTPNKFAPTVTIVTYVQFEILGPIGHILA